MCGILGVWAPDPEEAETAARRGLDALRHRGPDDFGFATLRLGDGVLALAHARLAILDLSPDARQPMFSGGLPEGARGTSVPGPPAAVVFNGEIYNFRALAEGLARARGLAFRSSGDTEVLLQGLRAEGLSFVDRLRGMFAFAFVEPDEARVTLVRDRLGIKPLYYASTGQRFVFGSEVRALLATGLLRSALDPKGLARFLAYGAVQDPDTLVAGVRSLPPAHSLAFERGRLGAPHRYWSLPTRADPAPTRAEAVAEIRRVLSETTALHLVSDVPVGAFLSGGIDSSALVGLAAGLQPTPVRTVTVVSADRSTPDESPLAELVARRHRTDHFVDPLLPRDAIERTRRSTAALDLPSVDGANTYLVSEAVRRAGCTVALSGLGGDEIFLGYLPFRHLRRALVPGRLPGAALTQRLIELLAPVDRHLPLRVASLLSTDGALPKLLAQQRALFFRPTVEALVEPAYRAPRDLAPWTSLDPEETPDDPVNVASAFELRGYCQNTLLRDADQMSMAHGLELRVPYLDHVLVETLLRLPGALKLGGETNKPLLVEAARDVLPEPIYRHPKRGFALAIPTLMRSTLRPNVERSLLSPHPVFARSPRRRLWQRFLAGDDRLASRVWALHRAVRWMESVLDLR